jgi:hypothetical protein
VEYIQLTLQVQIINLPILIVFNDAISVGKVTASNEISPYMVSKDLEDVPFQSAIPIFACIIGNKRKKFWEGLIAYLALI